MAEPDYEQIMDDREADRGLSWLRRMDRKYGIVTDHLPRTDPRSTCPCGRLWGGGQDAHNCRLLSPR